MIYALKGRRGYTLPYPDFCSIYRCASIILAKILPTIDYDVVVPIPSSSNVVEIFAKRAARFREDCLIVPCFDKMTFAEVLVAAPAVAAVEKRLRGQYKSQLNSLQSSKADDFFEMKKVSKRLRRYFTPIRANASAQGLTDRKILLIDDILGSGTSMITAANILQSYDPHSINGLTLMSRLSAT